MSEPTRIGDLLGSAVELMRTQARKRRVDEAVAECRAQLDAHDQPCPCLPCLAARDALYGPSLTDRAALRAQIVGALDEALGDTADDDPPWQWPTVEDEDGVWTTADCICEDGGCNSLCCPYCRQLAMLSPCPSDPASRP